MASGGEADKRIEARAPGPLVGGLAALAIVALVVGATLLGLFRPFDDSLTDRRFSLTERAPTGDIVFVEIDPASLRQIGVWPWPRHVYADLVDKLMALGAGHTVLDVDFSSTSTPAEDKSLADALGRAGGFVSLAAFRQFSAVTDRVEINLPLARFRAVADSVVVNMLAEPDGVVRRYPPGMDAGGKHYPTLAESLSDATLGQDDRFFVDYSIDASQIDRISVADVLDGKVDPARIAGKKIVVGASAQELRDLFTVPRFGTIPGTLLQILGAETLVQHRALHSRALWATLGSIFAMGFLFLALRGRLSLWKWAALTGAALVVLETTALLLQAEAGVLLRTAPADFAALGFLAVAVLEELEAKRRLYVAAARARDGMRRMLDRVIADNFDGVVIIDGSGRVVASSELAATLLGGGLSLVDAAAVDLLPPDLMIPVRRAIENIDTDQPRQVGPAELTLDLAGARRTLEYVVTLSQIEARDHQTPARHVVCMTFRDISERRAAQERLAFLARHDTLTGALSRRPFVDAIEAALSTDLQRDHGLTLLLLDLGRFGIINDTLGHSYGDAVLREVVTRLEAMDLLAVGRVGGDSFAVARAGILSPSESKRLSQHVISRVVEPYIIDDRRAVLSAHIGVTTTAISGFSGDILLSHADMALATAKRVPGNAVEIFTPALDVRLFERQEMEAALRQAIAESQFAVYYQPQVSLTDGRLLGVEALLRWHHPALGNVPPARFIPVAEETGLIVELGRRVLEAACLEATKWRLPVTIAVNVSPVQFELGDVVKDVRSVMAQTGLPPERLYLEITEGVFVANGHAANLALERLRLLGVGAALDDFGTGYSSLSYLGRLPIDTLKIDRSFIANLHSDPHAPAIIGAILTLARKLGKKTVAEGVETEAQADLLRSLGCDIAQGYLFGKPMPAEDIRALIDGEPDLQALAG